MIRSETARLEPSMTRVCDPSEIPDEGFLVRAVGGRNVALFRHDGVVRAVDNRNDFAVQRWTVDLANASTPPVLPETTTSGTVAEPAPGSLGTEKITSNVPFGTRTE